MTFLVCLSLRPMRSIESIRIFTFEPEGLLPTLNLEIQDLADLRPGYSSVIDRRAHIELAR
jgi:hypothetical protein